MDRVSGALTKFVKDTRDAEQVQVLGQNFGEMVTFYNILREQKENKAAD